MNDVDSEKPYIRLREIFNEIVLRDLILFSLLFLFTLAQGWNNIFLFVFPIISFAYSLIFRVISTNKSRILGENSPIIYNPLGLEKRHANRFVFSSLLQLILLFWIGAESLYRPQLIDNYNLYFSFIFLFIYSFGFYWIMIDIWKYSKIEVVFKNIDPQKLKMKTMKKVISSLKLEKFKKFSLINLIVFISLNVLNISFMLLILNRVFISYFINLPGTVLDFSLHLEIPISGFIILFTSPIITTLLLIFVYKDTSNFTMESFNQNLQDIPKDLKDKILENLKKITNNLELIE